MREEIEALGQPGNGDAGGAGTSGGGGGGGHGGWSVGFYGINGASLPIEGTSLTLRMPASPGRAGTGGLGAFDLGRDPSPTGPAGAPGCLGDVYEGTEDDCLE
jgi:hypothetical protein